MSIILFEVSFYGTENWEFFYLGMNQMSIALLCCVTAVQLLFIAEFPTQL